APLTRVQLVRVWPVLFPNPLISSAGALFSGRKQYETHAHTYTQLTTNTHAYPAAAVARRHSGRILELFVCVCVCLCVCASVPVSVVLARRRRRVCKARLVAVIYKSEVCILVMK
ncbi:AGAP008409-PA, partial [Anopheles gambiae str. PEST]